MKVIAYAGTGGAPRGSRCSEILEILNARLTNKLSCETKYDKYLGYYKGRKYSTDNEMCRAAASEIMSALGGQGIFT